MSVRKFKRSITLVAIFTLLVGCSPIDDIIVEDKTTEPLDVTKEEAIDNREENNKEDLLQSKILRLTRRGDYMRLDSGYGYATNAIDIIGNTVLGLFRLGPNNSIENSMVDTYQVSDDKLMWRIELKQGIQWMNGVEITAHDFVYAWRRLIDKEPDGLDSNKLLVLGLKNATEVINGDLPVEKLGIKAIGDYTLELYFSHEVPFQRKLLMSTALYPINQKFCEAQGEAYGKNIENTLFSGPFYVSKWDHNEYGCPEGELVLKKNMNYYDADNVELDEVNFMIENMPKTIARLFEEGTIDVGGISWNSIERYRSSDELIIIPKSPIRVLKIITRGPLLSNINARKAIAYGLDRSMLVNEILDDGSIEVDYMVPRGIAKNESGIDFRDLREPKTPYYEYNKEKSIEYWNKAKEELDLEDMTIEFQYIDRDQRAKNVHQQLSNILEGCVIKRALPYGLRSSLQVLDYNKTVISVC